MVVVIITTNAFFSCFIFSFLSYNLRYNYIISPLLIPLPSCPSVPPLRTPIFVISCSLTVVAICTYKQAHRSLCVRFLSVCAIISDLVIYLSIYLFIALLKSNNKANSGLTSKAEFKKYPVLTISAIIKLIKVLFYGAWITTVNSQMVFLFPTLPIIYSLGRLFYI